MVKQKKKDLIFVLIFIIIASGALLFLFGISYAKYRKMINGNVDAEIASWKIKINDEDISKKKVLSKNIVPTFLGDDHTKPGVMAPGSVGYFDIIIDSSEVEVDFTYEIDLETSVNSSVKDLKILSYIKNPDDGGEAVPYDSTISDTIEYAAKATVLRFNIEWDDSEGASMNNEEDTLVAGNDSSKALIDVQIKLNQVNN